MLNYSAVTDCFNPMDCSPQAPLSMGIFQAIILEWIAMISSRESSQPRDGTHVSYVSCTGRPVLYLWHHQDAPKILNYLPF